MSSSPRHLRTVLDLAKAEHEAARYPGDLAADVLPMTPAMALTLKPGAGPLTTNRWFWAFGTSSAVAASLVTAFLLTSHTPDVVTSPVNSALVNPFNPFNPFVVAPSGSLAETLPPRFEPAFPQRSVPDERLTLRRPPTDFASTAGVPTPPTSSNSAGGSGNFSGDGFNLRGGYSGGKPKFRQGDYTLP